MANTPITSYLYSPIIINSGPANTSFASIDMSSPIFPAGMTAAEFYLDGVLLKSLTFNGGQQEVVSVSGDFKKVSANGSGNPFYNGTNSANGYSSWGFSLDTTFLSSSTQTSYHTYKVTNAGGGTPIFDLSFRYPTVTFPGCGSYTGSDGFTYNTTPDGSVTGTGFIPNKTYTVRSYIFAVGTYPSYSPYSPPSGMQTATFTTSATGTFSFTPVIPAYTGRKQIQLRFSDQPNEFGAPSNLNLTPILMLPYVAVVSTGDAADSCAETSTATGKLIISGAASDTSMSTSSAAGVFIVKGAVLDDNSIATTSADALRIVLGDAQDSCASSETTFGGSVLIGQALDENCILTSALAAMQSRDGDAQDNCQSVSDVDFQRIRGCSANDLSISTSDVFAIVPLNAFAEDSSQSTSFADGNTILSGAAFDQSFSTSDCQPFDPPTNARFSDGFETAVLSYLFGAGQLPKPQSIYIGLYTMMRSATAEQVGGTEMSGLGYQRMQAAFVPSDIRVTDPRHSGTGTQMLLAQDIEWPEATANWPIIVGYGAYDAPVNGRLISYLPAQAISVEMGDSLRINARQLSVSLF